MASNSWNSRPYPPAPGTSGRDANNRNQRYSDRDAGDSRRDSRRDSRSDQYNSYRPGDYGRDNGNSYAPPPPNYYPPPPPPPTYSRNAPGYGGPGGDSYRPNQSDFTFRSEKPAGIQDIAPDSYRPSFDTRGRGRGSRMHRGDGRRGRGGAPYGPRLAANRALLQGDHNTKAMTEDFGDAESGATYLPVADLSDDDEVDMDISGDENDGQPSKKRARTTSNGAALEGSAAPQWSNPDPYFVLPPVPTAQKNKDVVAMIRKARVQPKDADASVPADAEEFIACDSDSDNERQAPPAAAPTAPRHGLRNQDSASTFRNNETYQSSAAPGSTDSYRPAENLRASHAGAANDYQSGNNQHAASVGGSANQPPNNQNSRQELNPSRKRTHNDEIKFPEHAKLKKGKAMPVGGFISFDWRVTHGEDPCPWLRDHSDTPQMGVWLHKEVMDFYDHVKPRHFEQRLRQDLVDELNRKTRTRYPGVTVHPFGSFMSGLYLPTGDMDLVLCTDGHASGHKAAVFDSRKSLFKFSGFLQKFGLARDLECITRAKVPLVKYIDSRTGLKVDISFENTTGITAINTFLAWKDKYPAMPILVTLIKHFLLMRGLNEPVNGGIGGFSVICLVVSMFQLLPEVQSQNLVPEHNLGQMLLHFFDYYGNKFQYETTAICMNPPRLIKKSQVKTFVYKSPDRLSIIDPNRADNDISGGSSNFAAVSRVFSEAFHALQQQMNKISQAPSDIRRNASILSVILEGNYSTFRVQRDFLEGLYNKKYGPGGVGAYDDEIAQPKRQPNW